MPKMTQAQGGPVGLGYINTPWKNTQKQEPINGCQKTMFTRRDLPKIERDVVYAISKIKLSAKQTMIPVAHDPWAPDDTEHPNFSIKILYRQF